LKQRKKRIRNLQGKLKKYKDKEFSTGIFLKIIIYPTKWSSLESDWVEKLDKNDADCRIIAEILVFSKIHPEDDIYFITADNTPYFLAKDLGINTIYWTDEEFKEIFERDESNIKKPKILTDLIIHFENGEKETSITSKIDFPSLETFMDQEFPEISEFKNQEEYALNNEDLTLNQIEKEGLEITNILNSFFFKDYEQFRTEVENYYNDLKEYKKYKEIKFCLSNTGNKPYNNVTIQIFTPLEKGFDIKSKNEIEKPERPKFERRFQFQLSPTLMSRSIHYPREYNIKYIVPKKSEERERNDLWDFGYTIKKIQHNITLNLYSIMIKFPDDFKTKKIYFSCGFVHDEEGKTKNQKLKLNIEI